MASLRARRSAVQGMGENCPFEFNFDQAAFKVGDVVSYRVTGSLEGFPFVGTLLEVHDDHVIISADPVILQASLLPGPDVIRSIPALRSSPNGIESLLP
jgi:hypothetical protein